MWGACWSISLGNSGAWIGESDFGKTGYYWYLYILYNLAIYLYIYKINIEQTNKQTLPSSPSTPLLISSGKHRGGSISPLSCEGNILCYKMSTEYYFLMNHTLSVATTFVFSGLFHLVFKVFLTSAFSNFNFSSWFFRITEPCNNISVWVVCCVIWQPIVG